MSQITNQQRDTAYEAASDAQKFLYEAPESGALLWKIAEKYHLIETEKYHPFATLVGDVILDLEKQTDLPTLLTEKVSVPFEQAIKITGDIIDFLNQTHPLPTPQPSTPAATNSTPIPQPPKNHSLESDIAETEAALKAIPQIRTMVHDAEQSTTHTSSQDELLNKDNRWS